MCSTVCDPAVSEAYKSSLKLILGHSPSPVVAKERRVIRIMRTGVALLLVSGALPYLAGRSQWSIHDHVTLNILCLACEMSSLPLLSSVTPWVSWALGAHYPLDVLVGWPKPFFMSTEEWSAKVHEYMGRGDLGVDSRCAICWDNLGSAQAFPASMTVAAVQVMHGYTLASCYQLQPWQADPACIQLTSCGHAFHASCMLSTALGKAHHGNFATSASRCPVCNSLCAGVALYLVPAAQTQQQQAAQACDQFHAILPTVEEQVSSLASPAHALVAAVEGIQGHRVNTNFTHPGVVTSTMGVLNKHAALQALPSAQRMSQLAAGVLRSAKAHAASLQVSATRRITAPMASGDPLPVASVQAVDAAASMVAAGGGGLAGAGVAAGVGRPRGGGTRQGSRRAQERR